MAVIFVIVSIGLFLNGHIGWGVACMLAAFLFSEPQRN